jgi:hypothetical protein
METASDKLLVETVEANPQVPLRADARRRLKELGALPSGHQASMTVSLTCKARRNPQSIGNRFEMVIADTQCPEMVDRVDHVVLVGT